MSRTRTGFTLVELLVAVSLMGLVGATAVASLAGGLRVWRRTADVGAAQEAALIALGRIRQDLRSLQPFAPLPFEGDADQCSFPTVARVEDAREAPRELGQLGYYVDPRDHVLCRTFVPYRLSSRQRARDRCRVALEAVSGVRFQYRDGTGRWTSAWDSQDVPHAVRVEITAGRGPAQTTLVLLPTASRSGSSGGGGGS